jgi:hypothetical protein
VNRHSSPEGRAAVDTACEGRAAIDTACDGRLLQNKTQMRQICVNVGAGYRRMIG